MLRSGRHRRLVSGHIMRQLEMVSTRSIAYRTRPTTPQLRRHFVFVSDLEPRCCFWKGEIRRETPVLFKLDDVSLVEGVVDLAFREDTDEFRGWTVVDFKTDREFGAASDRYSAQVSVYSAAVQAATGLLSRGILLVV